MIKPSPLRYVSLFAVLLLSACAAGKRVPEDSFYRLEHAAPETVQSAPRLPGVLLVQGGTAAPVYRDRALLHSEPGLSERLQRYHYHYWIDTPPLLVQRGLADYLRQSGVAKQVVMPDDGVTSTYRLRVDIERFEHVRDAKAGVVAVALRISLTERATGKLLLQEKLQQQEIVAGQEFLHVSLAYQRALTDLYEKILALLVTAG